MEAVNRMLSFFNAWIATPLMGVEFLLFGYLYASHLKRHEYFYLRYLALSLMEVLFIFLVEFFYSVSTGVEFQYGVAESWDYRQTIFKFFFFLLIYAITFFVFMASYKERVSTIFLVSASVFATQHIAYNLSLLLGNALSFLDETLRGWLYLIAHLVLFLIAAILVLLLGRRYRERVNPYKGNAKRKVAASSIVIVVCIGLYRINMDMPSTNSLFSIAFSLYAIISCSLLLLLFFGLRESDRTHAEAEAYRELLHQQKTQYEISKKNIELINEKCHDLKHQIHALRTSDNKEYVKEIEHEIMIYDTSVKTGSEVLDVILREKSLQCEAEGISLTCLLDGQAISFMDEMDVYSLFGNLLSNAFEAAQLLEDRSKRTISLSGRNVGNMFFLHEENYVSEAVQIEDGLPKTTKKDTDYHGFGMKSMRRIAEKYGGEMGIKCDDGKFSIDFVFPLPPNA